MDTLLQMGVSNGLMATILAVLAAGVGRLCRRPALVHCLWLLVLLKFVTPSFVMFPMPWPDGSKTAVQPVSIEPALTLGTRVGGDQDAETKQTVDAAVDWSVGVISSSPASRLDEPESLASPSVDRSDSVRTNSSTVSLSGAVAIVWLAGSICWFSFVAYRIYRFRRLLRCARRALPQLSGQVQRWAERLGLAACPGVWLLPGRVSPMVWALGGRPRLFVSSALWDRLTSEQQTTLLVHELAHLRRRDHWVRGLELLVTGLYWWHPVVWWACREIREAEEQCCDAWVVWTLPQAARIYATALLETIDFLSETPNALPAVASGIGHVHDLRRRLTMIMHGTTPRGLSGAGLLGVLGLGAFLLALGPSWAQVPEPRARRAAQEAEEERRAAEEEQAQEEEARQQETRGREEKRNRIEAEQRNKFMAERQALAAQVEHMRANLEMAMMQLKQAEERLAQLQERERGGSREAAGSEGTRQRTARARGPRDREQPPDPERRISELERKLDELLNEVQSLRREMRRGGPRGMSGAAPGMPSAMPAPTPRPGMRPPANTPPQPRAPGGFPPAFAVPPSPASTPAPAAPALAPQPVPPEAPEPPSPEASSSIPL